MEVAGRITFSLSVALHSNYLLPLVHGKCSGFFSQKCLYCVLVQLCPVVDFQNKFYGFIKHTKILSFVIWKRQKTCIQKTTYIWIMLYSVVWFSESCIHRKGSCIEIVYLRKEKTLHGFWILIYIYRSSYKISEKFGNSCANICLWPMLIQLRSVYSRLLQLRSVFKQTMKFEHCFLETYVNWCNLA